MARLVDETLEAWREGERLLGDLTPLSDEHQAVEDAVAALRSAYQKLTSRRVSKPATEAIAQLTEQHLETIRRIRQELAG